MAPNGRMVSSITPGAGFEMPALVATYPRGHETTTLLIVLDGRSREWKTDRAKTTWASDDGATSAAATATSAITHLPIRRSPRHDPIAVQS